MISNNLYPAEVCSFQVLRAEGKMTKTWACKQNYARTYEYVLVFISWDRIYIKNFL